MERSVQLGESSKIIDSACASLEKVFKNTCAVVDTAEEIRIGIMEILELLIDKDTGRDMWRELKDAWKEWRIKDDEPMQQESPATKNVGEREKVTA
ncbi:MAG TPA: hypothetical protein VI873_00115 [Candidatus Peribacteraceae bacterium]|nr:hypothetical protein [Candidatus Peribacteraceae bacterium]